MEAREKMTDNIQGDFLKELFSLDGKVAVVVGGTGVLCGEMARGFCMAGSKVVLVGRNPKKAEDHFKRWGSSEQSARFLKADATIRSEVERKYLRAFVTGLEKSTFGSMVPACHRPLPILT